MALRFALVDVHFPASSHWLAVLCCQLSLRFNNDEQQSSVLRRPTLTVEHSDASAISRNDTQQHISTKLSYLL